MGGIIKGITQKMMFKIGIKRLPVLLIFIVLFTPGSHAQILKKIGKKIERKVEQRADRKVDKGIEKGLDKVEEGIESPTKKTTEETQATSKKEEVRTPLENKPYSLEEAATAKSNNGLIMVSENCDDFIWFKKGAYMKFESKNSKEKKVQRTSMTVQKVFSEGSVTIAEIVTSDNDNNEFILNFKCSGNRLYMDFAAAMQQALAKSGQESAEVLNAASNVEMGFSDGFMTIPKNMYPGQKLDDATFTMKSGTKDMEMTVTSSLTERQVVAREKITTPAGTFDCMKITGTRKTTMNMLGKDRNMGKPTEEFVWFAPDIGMVKTESYSEKGKVEYTQHLVEFKL